jgi:hypothetical protein
VIKLEHLIELVKDVESQDPIDWGMLNIDEKSALKLVALDVMEMFPPREEDDERHLILMVTVTKLILENFCLNLKLHGKR